MAEITRILPAYICRQFFFFITTTASTRCLDQKFQLICYSLRVNATRHITTTVVVQAVQLIAERLDSWSGETLLAPCTRKKRLQRKMTEDYYWTGVLACSVSRRVIVIV